MQLTYYRPEWIQGRFKKANNNYYAIIYNLLEGMSHYLESDSAKIISVILQSEINTPINVDKFSLDYEII